MSKIKFYWKLDEHCNAFKDFEGMKLAQVKPVGEEKLVSASQEKNVSIKIIDVEKKPILGMYHRFTRKRFETR